MPTLTFAERLILHNQYEILKFLDSDRRAEFEQAQQIVAEGYETFYSELQPAFADEPVPDDVMKEVMNIFDMFRAITFSAKKLKYTPKSPNATFEGFDGNNDHPQYGIAQFLRKTMRKWSELGTAPDNSHSSMSLPTYRAMLRRWDSVGRKHDLSADEIELIAG